jgi:hypothetical protein
MAALFGKETHGDWCGLLLFRLKDKKKVRRFSAGLSQQ